MGRARDFWRSNAATADACLRHPFLRGIADGTLPRGRFLFYVGQDAFYLDAYARAYALALAKAPDRAALATFHDLLGGALSEIGLHREYAQRWGADLDPLPAPATLAYTDFLLRVAWSEGPGRIAAAMAPCMRLYAYLGQALESSTRTTSPYAEWVRTYADGAFGALARRLEDVLDRLDDNTADTADYYRQAMRLELAFFDSAWQGP
ncbi:MAG TPA: TenA family protein [Bacillota bacterium]|nr:TenA family protein [Bacillota bacterium]